MRMPGKIYIVGTGPGTIKHITPYAQQTLRSSEVIVGLYIALIRDLIQGKTVSLISGGDLGIYAMAGLV